MPDPARVKPWRHSENQAGTCGHVASGGGAGRGPATGGVIRSDLRAAKQELQGPESGNPWKGYSGADLEGKSELVL